jgi:hypothetical protein
MPILPGPLPADFRTFAEQRIGFLGRFAETADKQRELDETQAALAAADALTEAASLAFASDQTALGYRFVERTFSRLTQYPFDAPVLLRSVLLGALLGRFTVALQPEGIVIGDEQVVKWPEPSTLLEIGGTLLAAALANPRRGALPDPDLGGLPGRVLFAAMEAHTWPAFDLRPNLEVARVSDAARIAFGALHQRYGGYLLLLSLDRPGWESRQMHVDLIDWSLLALHVGLRRRQIATDPYVLTDDSIGAIVGRYIDGVAGEFAALTVRRD